MVQLPGRRLRRLARGRRQRGRVAPDGQLQERVDGGLGGPLPGRAPRLRAGARLGRPRTLARRAGQRAALAPRPAPRGWPRSPTTTAPARAEPAAPAPGCRMASRSSGTASGAACRTGSASRHRRSSPTCRCARATCSSACRAEAAAGAIRTSAHRRRWPRTCGPATSARPRRDGTIRRPGRRCTPTDDPPRRTPELDPICSPSDRCARHRDRLDVPRARVRSAPWPTAYC